MYLRQQIQTVKNIIASTQVKPATPEETRFGCDKDLKTIRNFEKALTRLGFRGERVIDNGITATYKQGDITASLNLVRTPRFNNHRDAVATVDHEYHFKLEDLQKDEPIVHISHHCPFPLNILTDKIKKYNS